MEQDTQFKEPESVCASWHKDTVAKWYPLQGSNELVPLNGKVEGHELKHTLLFE